MMQVAQPRRLWYLAAAVLLLAVGWPAAGLRSAADAGDATDVAADSGPAYTFTLKADPATPVYYEVESEFRDSGGVAPLLTYSSSIKERRTITQRVDPSASQAAAAPGGGLISLVWECQRYEAREQNMKEEAAYDSNRHLYPPGSLRELEAIAGSTTKFQLNPATGAVSGIAINPAPITCPIPRRGSMSKTVERCNLTPANMQYILETLAATWFPPGPKRVGETWTRSFSEPQANLGAVQIAARFTLKSVRQEADRQIALIDVAADVTFDRLAPAAPPPSTVLINPPTHDTAQAATQPAKPITPPAADPPAAQKPGEHASNKPPRPSPVDRSPLEPHDAPPAAQPSSRPAPDPPATHTPAATTQRGATSRPIAYPRPQRQSQLDFRMEKGAFAGSIEFDLTAGRTLSVSLRKEVSLAAEMESQSTGKMQVRTGTMHQLRIKALASAPTLPAIVGGKVPPKLTEAEQAIVEQLKQQPTPASQPGASDAVGPGTRGSVAPQRRMGGSRSGPGAIMPKGQTEPGGNATGKSGKTGPLPRNHAGARSKATPPTTQPSGKVPATSD